MSVQSVTTPATVPEPSSPIPRRRRLWWLVGGGTLVVGALIAVLATVQPAASKQAFSPLVGKQAPVLSGPGLNGGQFSLEAMRGHWVLVNFMASWCPPCQAEMPQLKSLADHTQSGVHLNLLTVAYDPSDVSHLASFLSGEHAAWPAVRNDEATVNWGVSALPTSYLVTPDGSVYAEIQGEVNVASVDHEIATGEAVGLGG